jgi:hypothetical protein
MTDVEFKAEKIDGVVTVKAIVEKKGNDVIIHVPSFPLIEKLSKQLKEAEAIKEDG